MYALDEPAVGQLRRGYGPAYCVARCQCRAARPEARGVAGERRGLTPIHPLVQHQRHLASQQANVNRTNVCGNDRHGLLGLQRVAGVTMLYAAMLSMAVCRVGLWGLLS